MQKKLLRTFVNIGKIRVKKTLADTNNYLFYWKSPTTQTISPLLLFFNSHSFTIFALILEVWEEIVLTYGADGLLGCCWRFLSLLGRWWRSTLTKRHAFRTPSAMPVCSTLRRTCMKGISAWRGIPVCCARCRRCPILQRHRSFSRLVSALSVSSNYQFAVCVCNFWRTPDLTADLLPYLLNEVFFKIEM